MASLQDWRCKHTSLIFACRTIGGRFGEEAVDAVAEQHMKNVREAFAEKAKQMGCNDLEAFARQSGDHPDTHDKETIRLDAKVYETRITRCDHAMIFAEYNAQDIGLKFMCAGDDAMIQGFNPKIKLERPEIIMKGDDCCHFIFTLDD